MRSKKKLFFLFKQSDNLFVQALSMPLLFLKLPSGKKLTQVLLNCATSQLMFKQLCMRSARDETSFTSAGTR